MEVSVTELRQHLQGDPIARIIVATALLLQTPVVSADNQIRALPWIRTIW